MPDSGKSIAFVVVGFNDQEHLARAVAAASDAVEGDRDEVVFVDSDSTDSSLEIARALGVRTLSAPRGKGAAMRFALSRLSVDWVVFLDADLIGSERNIAAELASALGRVDAPAMVLGEFRGRSRGDVLSNTWLIYEPLVRSLFPESVVPGLTKPLTGFRALSLAALPPTDAMPSDFGVEAWLNIELPLAGYTTDVIDIGWYEGPFKYKPRMGAEIGNAVLDSAQRHGRLAPRRRGAWEQWMEEQISLVVSYGGTDAERGEYLAKVERARNRPLPPAH